MEGLYKCNQEWLDLKEYLEVNGDFVLGDPLITDEIIKETWDIMVKEKTFEMDDFPTDQVKKLFYQKIGERIIYEEPDIEEEFDEEVFMDENKDAIIKEVIAKMVSDIRKRRGYEY